MTGTPDGSLPTDPSVAKCVFFLLINLSMTGCSGAPVTGPLAAMASVATASQQSQDSQTGHPESAEERAVRLALPLTFAPERMSVKAHHGDVQLGSPLALELTLAPGKLVGSIDITQSTKNGASTQGSGTARVISEDGTDAKIEIVPAQLGDFDVEIGVLYSDNAVVRQTIHLHSVPSSKGLKKFSLDEGGPALDLNLNGEEFKRQRQLMPTVSYEGLDSPLYLNDCSGIPLSIDQDESDPVISVTKTGFVKALREGHATIKADFDGVEDKIAVTVYSHAVPHPQ